MDPLVSPAIIRSEQDYRRIELRTRIRELSTNIEKNVIDLGLCAVEAQDLGIDLATEAESLGIKHRRLQYLARICRICAEVGLQRVDYESAGVTKLRVITSLNPKESYFNRETGQNESLTEHIVELVADAPELSVKEVQEKVDKLKGLTEDNAMLHKSYSVTKSCYENTILRCFEEIRKRLGSAGRDDEEKAKEYSDGAVLEALCAEYLGDPRNFLEDTDESQAQIEVQEETNVRDAGAPASVAVEEVSQNALPTPRQFIPSE